MNIRHWIPAALLLGVSMIGNTMASNGKDLTPNSADILLNVAMPPLKLDIKQAAGNPGGVGCVGVETWDPVAGRCTEVEFIRNTAAVVQIIPSPPSVAADGTWSTQYAYVRDGLGRPVFAGIAVQWLTSFGYLNTSTSYTDAGGVAYAAVASGSAGSATVYAKTMVSNYANTGITFTATGPTILSFTMDSEYANKRIPNQLRYDRTGTGIDPGISYGSYYSNTFVWSAINATRYELVDSGGNIMYSGSATSVDLRNRSVKLSVEGQAYVTWTLRAYNGGQITSQPISMKVYIDGDSGGGDGGG
ncbi:Ig-like domain-containing protein [Pseudomonas sp. UMAB-40]|uniref:Ig-like domain-containing protein n=1 Tax=Pseudomonas sp. UMAB-40 TaxID=1365407 RepID=UPI001C563610|nr:hypothetical protein [Pseudomonas sp. UMAB-40]